MENFLDNSINFDEFESAFTISSRKIGEESRMFTRDLKQIEKFQPSTRPYQFASYMSPIFRAFEEIDEKYITEQEAKDQVKETYLKS